MPQNDKYLQLKDLKAKCVSENVHDLSVYHPFPHWNCHKLQANQPLFFRTTNHGLQVQPSLHLWASLPPCWHHHPRWDCPMPQRHCWRTSTEKRSQWPPTRALQRWPSRYLHRWHRGQPENLLDSKCFQLWIRSGNKSAKHLLPLRSEHWLGIVLRWKSTHIGRWPKPPWSLSSRWHRPLRGEIIHEPMSKMMTWRMLIYSYILHLSYGIFCIHMPCSRCVVCESLWLNLRTPQLTAEKNTVQRTTLHTGHTKVSDTVDRWWCKMM